MVNVLSLTLAALSLSGAAVAAPAPSNQWSHSKDAVRFSSVDDWISHQCPGKYQQCTKENMQVRKDFDSMEPSERKAFTDAINCIAAQPSQLDPTVYPAAINKYFDYAVVHVNKTRTVHLDGFFLVWHRLFEHIFEQDLRNTCGYTGSYPYWNWPATVDNLEGSPIFNGDEYSMSSNGYFTNNDPIVLAPGFSLPHGSGGGCIMSGPFSNWNYTMLPVSNAFLLNGTEPPHSVFDNNPSCLTRDLNTYVGQTYCNYTAVQVAVEQPDITSFETIINGVIGGGSLGIHSGAHFIMGNPASNIFVSAQDPIWYPLHVMLDRVYVSWQSRHPSLANSTFGTGTALNLPPSANVTLDSVVPDAGYFTAGQSYTYGELLSTTSGPFCYTYDTLI